MVSSPIRNVPILISLGVSPLCLLFFSFFVSRCSCLLFSFGLLSGLNQAHDSAPASDSFVGLASCPFERHGERRMQKATKYFVFNLDVLEVVRANPTVTVCFAQGYTFGPPKTILCIPLHPLVIPDRVLGPAPVRKAISIRTEPPSAHDLNS